MYLYMKMKLKVINVLLFIVYFCVCIQKNILLVGV